MQAVCALTVAASCLVKLVAGQTVLFHGNLTYMEYTQATTTLKYTGM